MVEGLGSIAYAAYIQRFKFTEPSDFRSLVVSRVQPVGNRSTGVILEDRSWRRCHIKDPKAGNTSGWHEEQDKRFRHCYRSLDN